MKYEIYFFFISSPYEWNIENILYVNPVTHFYFQLFPSINFYMSCIFVSSRLLEFLSCKIVLSLIELYIFVILELIAVNFIEKVTRYEDL